MKVLHAAGRAFQTASLGFLLYKLIVLAVNALAFPVLKKAGQGDDCSGDAQPAHPLPAFPLEGEGQKTKLGFPAVSILIPVRDEAHNLPHTLPRLLMQGAHEVLILDDQSGDDSARIAGQMMASIAGARVITGQPRPPGWHGKPWACMQLGQAATGEVLIFTDADVCWEEGTLPALLAELQRTGADLLTVWPRQQTRTPGERLLAPLVDDVLLSILPAPIIRLPYPSMSAGNGQLMAFRRPAYERVGGHALVRNEVLEDVRFAARLKEKGGTVALALGAGLMSVRMYRSYSGSGGAVQGFAKSLHAVHGGSRALMAASWLWHFAVYTWPWLRGQRSLILLGLLERLLVNVKTGRTRPADLLEVLLTPVTPLAALPVYLLGWRRTYRWKGREYSRTEQP
jgi:cellulose synthase/poly-beta-1,6-N-acetylglucosamine synthase-like glycosyltransferase